MIGQQRCDRDTHEGVQRVPDHVECGNLVNDKLNRKHRSTDDDDPPVREDVQTYRQLNPVRARQQTEREQSGIHVETSGKTGGDDERGNRSWSKCFHRLILVLATRGMLLAVYHDPPVVCAAMRGAMHIMNTGGEMSPRWEERLAVFIYLRVGWSRDYTIEIVVGHHFDQTRVSVRKG